MKFQIALAVFGLACLALANPIARVEEKIYQDLEQSDLINVMVTFRRAETKAAWDRFYSLRLTTREAILETQHAILKDHADVIQADVTALLEKTALAGKRHYLEQLWITTELIVRDVDRETVELLRNHPDVESLVAEQFIQLEETEEGESFDLRDYNNTIQNEWGIVNVQAPAAWARGFNGAGQVIGNIDTGVRATHVLLASRYRGNQPGENHDYNWRAPTGSAAVPADTNGHGTHCIGTHSGTGGIGVAPGSLFTACRGCATAACSTFDLNGCGNFMACPTNTAGGAAQCARAPHLVSNSWGGGGGQTWYNPILTAWRNAGIAGIFAQGNSGTACNTAGSPADQPLAFGVGSITSTNTLSTFSSVGPGPAGAIKPNVAAPGTSVASASHLADTGLRTLSGTSMACPHAAGAYAVARQSTPGAGVVAIQNRIQSSALAHVSGGRTCAGVPEGSRPNHHVGHGRINVNGAA
ncbi:bacillopeptidase F-like [Bradysia coprophila]|uniref:bacillopeptidase F-like n=1 Tax=Bradysia coprophila TaxID=38358 RepID=UPI00187D8EB7|nr:bacillopeptidase F-like [Bradysia coprophila]